MHELNYYNNTKYKLFIGKSKIPNAGLGLFTAENIPADTFIGYYEGEIVKDDNVTDYSFELSKKYFIDATKFPRSYIAMVNDSYKSNFIDNCEFRMIYYDSNNKVIPPTKRKIALYSTRKIKKLEELFASYGEEYWISRLI